MKLFKHSPNKREYTKDMLPHNRREVFFDVLKLQWKSLLLIGALVLAASIPLIACYVVEQLYSSMMLDQVVNLENTAEYMAALNKINVFLLVGRVNILKIKVKSKVIFLLHSTYNIVYKHVLCRFILQQIVCKLTTENTVFCEC